MTGVIGITDNRIVVKLQDLIAQLGQFAALSYAQRAAGTRETGTLSPSDVEQINGSNVDNYIRRLRNLALAHVNNLPGTAEQHTEWANRVRS